MKRDLKQIDFYNFPLENGTKIYHLPLFYEVFGQVIGTAPIVVVNHALTGNSEITGKNGWWKTIVGKDKTIDISIFTVIVFNIPGNGFDGNPDNLILNYNDFTIRDVAKIFCEGLRFLNINSLFAVIGGSLGGAIAWEMTILKSITIQNLIPIASDWKATNWVIANVLIQEQILKNSDNPIVDARIHAMLLYRTPQSLNQRFKRELSENASEYKIENWLKNHGSKLKNRFQLESYRLMNNLLRTNDVTRNRTDLKLLATEIDTAIHIIGVSSDNFFTAQENRDTYIELKTNKEKVYYHEINSIHGHDAFLIEYEQLEQILEKIFKTQKKLKLCQHLK